jgi:hypothetical protein
MTRRSAKHCRLRIRAADRANNCGAATGRVASARLCFTGANKTGEEDISKRLLLFLRFTPDEAELKRRAEDAAMRIRHRNRAALNVWRNKRRPPALASVIVNANHGMM